MKIHVLKPFVFSRLPDPGHKLPVERHFSKGVHEIDEVTAAHPYIKAYADGHIENPAQARKRLETAVAAAERQQAEAAQIKELSEAAMARTIEQNQAITAEARAAIEKELNTPANLLKNKDEAERLAVEAQAKADADAKAEADAKRSPKK